MSLSCAAAATETIWDESNAAYASSSSATGLELMFWKLLRVYGLRLVGLDTECSCVCKPSDALRGDGVIAG